MSTNPPPQENTYVIDPESGAEMARLMIQDRLMTQGMGGPFPERADLTKVHDILDIACGPGGWVLDVALEHSQKQVIGIDLSERMVGYARAQASAQGLDNVSFRVMNVLKPLEFPTDSFDVVNARSLIGFMPKTAWPSLIQECLRILRPGGVLRLTESEWAISNSLAFEKLSGMILHTGQLIGQSFSPDGRHMGITSVLGPFLRGAGCQNIQQKAYVIDWSTGTEAHGPMYQDCMVAFKLLQPFLIKMKVTTLEEVEEMYQQVLTEMYADSFCAIQFYLSVWGEKPTSSLE